MAWAWSSLPRRTRGLQGFRAFSGWGVTLRRVKKRVPRRVFLCRGFWGIELRVPGGWALELSAKVSGFWGTWAGLRCRV